MRRRSHIILLLLLLPLCSSGGILTAHRFDFDSGIGLVTVDARGPCLTIQQPNLSPDTPLSLTWVLVGGDTSEPELLDAKVAGSLVHACEPTSQESGDYFYRLSVPADTVSPKVIYFAVASPPSAIRDGKGGVRWDLDDDGVLEVFRACTSSEGLHFTIWSGLPLEGKRRWHRYFYLGYDVEPSCTDRDY